MLLPLLDCPDSICLVILITRNPLGIDNSIPATLLCLVHGLISSYDKLIFSQAVFRIDRDSRRNDQRPVRLTIGYLELLGARPDCLGPLLGYVQ